MAAVLTKNRLLAIAWCAGVPVAVIGVGVVIASVVDDPILGTAVLGGVTTAVVGAVRLIRPRWLAYGPEPDPELKPRAVSYGWAVAGGTVLGFVAGQAMAMWLYAMGGSAGFDQSVRIRRDAGTAMTLLLTLVVAPVAEETLFRGLLYPLLRQRVSIAVAVLVSTATFGMMHGNVVQFAAVLPMAILLGLVYERTRRLWTCVLIHLGFNAAALIVPPQALTWLATPVAILLLMTAFLSAAFMLYQQLPDRVIPVTGNADEKV